MASLTPLQSGLLALSCFTFTMSNPAGADLLGDHQLRIALRNAYIVRDFKQNDAPKSRAGSWNQGIDVRFISGYTDGPVQFAFESGAQWAGGLDGGGGRGPDTVIPYDDRRREQAREYGRIAGTGKIRASRTELRVGELRPMLPVAYMDDSRQLITTYQGALLESKE